MANCNDGFNYCELHKDGKGLNFYIYDKEDRASISEKEIEQLLKQNGLK